jgi:hypothetical protein
VWILISGLDDLFIGLRWFGLRKSIRLPTPEERDGALERRIAVFVARARGNGADAGAYRFAAALCGLQHFRRRVPE